MIVTNCCAASSATVWFLIDWIRARKPKIEGLGYGVLSGLVASTSLAGFIDVGYAMIVGSVAAIVGYIFCDKDFKMLFKYDDALNVFGIHGIIGIVSILMAAFIADKNLL